MASEKRKLVFLGVGQVARALADKARETNHGYELYGTTRSAEHADAIRSAGIEPIIVPTFSGNVEQLTAAMKDAFVVATFPPEPSSDCQASVLAEASAAKIVYVSSTSVYGKIEGTIDENTSEDFKSPQSTTRLQAEESWWSVGATIIRAPGIYGRGNGLHHRLLSGQYRLPGDGGNYVSRIHVDDLSAMILRALEVEPEESIYLAGDRLPTTHRELVEWLVERLSLPFPESVPLESCHYTQQGNRKIDARKIVSDLKIELKYPTYKEGYGEELSRLQRTS